MESEQIKQTVAERVGALIDSALKKYRCSYTLIDEDNFCPLVDVLTPPGDKDIERGEKEMADLAEAVWMEIDTAGIFSEFDHLQKTIEAQAAENRKLTLGLADLETKRGVLISVNAEQLAEIERLTKERNEARATASELRHESDQHICSLNNNDGVNRHSVLPWEKVK